MLSSIASYLFGFGSEDAPAEDSAAPSGEDQPQDPEKLTAIETDGDWMLVEKNDKSPTPSENGEEKKEEAAATGTPDVVQQPAESVQQIVRRRIRSRKVNAPPPTGGPVAVCASPKLMFQKPQRILQPTLPSLAASSVAAFCSLSSTPAILEGSWYITPPSCFTARPGPQMLPHASPMENLLIEHPSMSVYGPKPDGRYYGIVGPVGPVRETDEQSEMYAQPTYNYHTLNINMSKMGRRETRRGCREPYCCNLAGRNFASRVAAMAAADAERAKQKLAKETAAAEAKAAAAAAEAAEGNDENDADAANASPVARAASKSQHVIMMLSLAEEQKIKQRQQVKMLHRKQLERLNKVQEFESIGKKQRRKDFLRQPCSKGNNRKY